MSVLSIASRRIVAQSHDRHDESNEMFHIFDQTRVSLYYGVPTLSKKNTAILVWPWMKIRLDVSLMNQEWDGKSLLETNVYRTPLLWDNRL